MKKVMAGPLRWLFKSAPGVALLVIAAGVGVGYAASSGSENGSGGKALEDFGSCMRENAPQPGGGDRPPGPAGGEEAFEAAFDACKGKLTDSQRQQFEARHAQREKFRACMEDNGAPRPPVPGKSGERPDHPSGKDRQAMRTALKACAEELPEGARVVHGGPGGPGGPHGCPGGPPPGPPPPPGAGNGYEDDSTG